MQVGKVVGSIVSTQKHESLKGMKLMMVDILNGEQELTGRIEIAVDTVCAGEGEYVLLLLIVLNNSCIGNSWCQS